MTVKLITDNYIMASLPNLNDCHVSLGINSMAAMPEDVLSHNTAHSHIMAGLLLFNRLCKMLTLTEPMMWVVIILYNICLRCSGHCGEVTVRMSLG